MNKGEHCEQCGDFVEGFEYKICCNEFDCGCQGRPVLPCVCGEACWHKLINVRPPPAMEARFSDNKMLKGN